MNEKRTKPATHLDCPAQSCERQEREKVECLELEEEFGGFLVRQFIEKGKGVFTPGKNREGVDIRVLEVDIGHGMVRRVLVRPPSDGKALVYVSNEVTNSTVQIPVLEKLVMEHIVGEPS